MRVRVPLWEVRFPRVCCWLLLVGGILFILDVPHHARIVVYREQYFGFFLALTLASAFLIRPARTIPAGRTLDRILALLSLGIGGYLAWIYPTLIDHPEITPDRWILGILALGLVVEATRRFFGWALTGLVLAGLLYALWGHLLPGILGHRPFGWDRVMSYLYLDGSAIPGITLDVASTIVLSFVLFGQLLIATGGSRTLTDLAGAAVSGFRGGPAKVSVVSSGLFGTVSGSAAANVAIDGPITIPMMKAAGFPAHVAGAIEAVASTGGQLVPPVMGAAAFLIAEFLAIPYREVLLAAVIPAGLFYFSLFVQVDLEAARSGIGALPRSQRPPLGRALLQSWRFFAPLAFLIYGLFWLVLDPAKASLYATGLVLLISFFRGETRLDREKLRRLVDDTGKAMVELGVVSAAAGALIGVVNLTGAGLRLTLTISSLGEHVWLLLPMIALAALVMGMGLPTTAVYVIVALMVAPALVQLGFDPLAAHLFVFYYAMLSMITPPVCIAAFVAAPMAGVSPMKLGVAASKLGWLLYLVPFLFIGSPALLSKGPLWIILLASVASSLAVWGVAVALYGYARAPVGTAARLVLGLGSGALFVLSMGIQRLDGGVLVGLGGLGFALTGGILLWEYRLKVKGGEAVGASVR